MVGIRSFDLTSVFARPQLGLLDDFVAGCGIWQHWYGHQSYRHHSFHAMPRDETQSHASAGLAELDHGWNGHPGDLASNRGSDHASHRSLSRRALFLHPKWERTNAFGAFFLCFWT